MNRLLLLAAFLPLAASAQPTFTELAVADTLFTTPDSTDFWISSVAPADADADGDLDLLVLGYYVVYFQSVEDRLILYRNDGPDGPDGPDGWAFTPIEVPIAGFSSSRSDLAWADYDNDGDPDLLLPSVPADGFGYDRTKLLRNDGPGAGDAWVFTDTEAPLDTTSNAVSVWGDNDGDQDLDLLLANVTVFPPGNDLSIFRNDGGALVEDTSEVVHIRYGNADWGDADGDGDLDIVHGGNLDLPDGTGETVVRILLNQGEGQPYTPLTVIEQGDLVGTDYAWLDFLAVSWADYDGDGDVDLLVAGELVGNGEIIGRSIIYTNEGGGLFTPSPDLLPAPIAGNSGGAFVWFDLDNDGDLDHFVAGGYFADQNGLLEARAQLFRNDSGTEGAFAAAQNAPPTPPSGLRADVDGDDVRLAWAPSMDDSTPRASLTYELRVRPLGAPAPSERPLPEQGNVSLNTGWTLHGLPAGTYVWRVQALDNAFAASPPAEGTFTVRPAPAAVVVSAQGGTPVVVPPAGGPVRFTVAVRNLTGQPLQGEVWAEVTGPVTLSPVLGPRTVTIAPGATLRRTLTQVVPANAPAGTYTYTVRIGRYPGVIVASDAFAIVKQPGARLAASSADTALGWTVSGWDEAAPLAASSALPGGYALSEAYPNPATGAARLTLEVAAAQAVRAEVYDGLGRRVAVLADGALDAGAHALLFDGSSLPAGAYVVRVTGETFSTTRRVTLVR